MFATLTPFINLWRKKNMIRKLKYFIVLVLFFPSCTEQREELPPAETKILGHRGSGSTSFSNYQENTYHSVKNAFNKLHGAEIDVQCSKDGTIWLFHDAGLPENDLGLFCVPGSSDEDLIEMANRDTLFTLTRLEEIFELMTKMEKRPVLSLDVKGNFPNGCFDSDNAPRHYFDMMAQSLNTLLRKYNIHKYVMVETDYTSFLDKMLATEPLIECFLLGYDNFGERMEAAMSKSYHGISYNFNDPGLTKEDIITARQNGLKIQLWTIYNEEDFKRALSWGPDFIQTGNVELGKTFID